KQNACRGRPTTRRTKDGLNGESACRIRWREISGAAHHFAGRDEPVLRESGLQSNRGRTLNANLHVAPVLFVLRVAAPMICDAGASGKRDSSIDDHRFSMISMVESSDGRLENRVVPGQPALAVAQNLQNVSADRR